jgi:hypothetical protein
MREALFWIFIAAIFVVGCAITFWPHRIQDYYLKSAREGLGIWYESAWVQSRLPRASRFRSIGILFLVFVFIILYINYSR